MALTKQTFENVKINFSKNNLTLCEDSYVNSTTKMMCVDRNGYKLLQTYYKLTKGQISSPFHKSNPFTVENIKLWTSKNRPEYELISTEYVNSKENLEWKLINSDLPPFQMNWDNFKFFRGHPALRYIKIANSNKLTKEKYIEQIHAYLEKFDAYENWDILDSENSYCGARNDIFFKHKDGYISSKVLSSLRKGTEFTLYDSRKSFSISNMILHLQLNTNLKLKEGQIYTGSRKEYIFICYEHGEFKTTWNRMLHHINSHDEKEYSGMGCLGCYLEKSRGDKSPHWNPNLTDEERKENRDDILNRKWRENIYKRDKYTCQCCKNKGGKLEAHHKNSYKSNINGRYDLSNGVTLCEKCHRTGEQAFHKLYGNKNNTKEQYEEWIQRVKE